MELMWNPPITYKAALWIISDSEIPSCEQKGFAGKISVNPNSGFFLNTAGDEDNLMITVL